MCHAFRAFRGTRPFARGALCVWRLEWRRTQQVKMKLMEEAMRRSSDQKRRRILLGEPRFMLWRPRLPVTMLEKCRLAKPANPQGFSHFGIPWGSYCEGCPYFSSINHKNWMRRGYCRMLSVGEWQRPASGLLSDGVKLCWLRPERGPDEVRRLRFAERPPMHDPSKAMRPGAKGLRRGGRAGSS